MSIEQRSTNRGNEHDQRNRTNYRTCNERRRKDDGGKGWLHYWRNRLLCSDRPEWRYGALPGRIDRGGHSRTANQIRSLTTPPRFAGETGDIDMKKASFKGWRDRRNRRVVHRALKSVQSQNRLYGKTTNAESILRRMLAC